MKKKIILWMLVFLVLINAVVGLGVRPARTNINYLDGETISISMKVVNNEHKDIDFSLSIESDLLKNYIKVPLKTYHLSSDEEYKQISFAFKLPRSIPSGTHTGYIIIGEEFPDPEDKTVTVRIELKHKVTLVVPSRDKDVSTELGYTEYDDTVDVFAKVKNTGRQNLQKVSTDFGIYDFNKKLLNFETAALALKTQDVVNFNAEIDKEEILTGEYDLKATVDYDTLRVIKTKEMIIGEALLNLTNFDKYFKANDITELNLELFNDWNRPLKDVYSVVTILDDSDNSLVQTKSVSQDIIARKQDKIKVYIDARDIEPSEQKIKIQVYYNNKVLEQITGASFLNAEEYSKYRKSGMTYIYILLGLILVILGVITIGLFKLLKKQKNM